MPGAIWEKCSASLQAELPAQQFNTWIRPLKVDDSCLPEQGQEFTHICLSAPNRFVMDWVNDKFLGRIHELVSDYSGGRFVEVTLVAAARQANRRFQRRAQVAAPNRAPAPEPQLQVQRAAPISQAPAMQNSGVSHETSEPVQVLQENLFASTDHPFSAAQASSAAAMTDQAPVPELEVQVAQSASLPRSQESVAQPFGTEKVVEVEGRLKHASNLDRSYTFQRFVEGKSNQLGLAAARQVADNPGGSYNPLFIYGGVGLGKTHLMQAVGSALLEKNPNAKVVYLHAERFVADMVKALQLGAISEFKRYYRSADALLIDDIQFFAGKERSQEEFFYTFNALLEGGQQIILTSDRYPKEINGLEERLKSRFGWGLTVAVEPPELETRVAILMKKAEQTGMDLPGDAAFFIAQRIRSNVRELEGALKRVIANANFTGRAIDVPLVRESLKDLLALQDKQVSIDNIQRVVAEYYKIKVSDLLSKRRSRSVARPRQVAMSLAKELTNHSLPEIGDAFGGRDHTTVLHACRKIKSLKEENADIREDVKNLLRSLTT